MDTSLALVPAHTFPPFFSKADGFLAHHNHDSGRFPREAEHKTDDRDGLGRTYGSDGLETVRSAPGMLIDIHI